MPRTPLRIPVAPGPALTDEERAIWEWQLDTTDFDGEVGQRRLRNATALVTRVGGLGSPVALELCAAGFGRIVLAHGGNLKPSDLNRQLAMHHAGLDQPRVSQAAARLRAFNPLVEVIEIPENCSPENAEAMLEGVDVAIDAAPLFEERLALQGAALPRGVPVIEAAMYDTEATLTTTIPGVSACVRCMHPVDPPRWKRRFPVIGAVSGTVGCLAAMEAIKLVAGFGETLAGRLLRMDLSTMSIQELSIERNPDCSLCGDL